MSNLPSRLILAIAFAVAAVVSVATIPRVEDVDSNSYRIMARGEPACRPYANRILHPAVVHAVVKMGLEPQVAFAAVAVASSAVFYVLLLMWMWRLRPFCMAFVILLSPLWWVWGGNIYIQDMFAAALAMVLFVAVRALHSVDSGPCRSRMMVMAGVALSLFLLQLTRESSAVFALVLAAIAWFKRDRVLALTSIGAMAAGMAVVAWFSRSALPNTNELGGCAYMVCKVLANGVRNFTGMIPWNDGYAIHLPYYYPDPPLWKCTLPAFLQWGNVHEIGIYSFAPATLFVTLLKWMSYFPGALILVALQFRRQGWRMRHLTKGDLARLPVDIRLALFSGGIFWLLAPFCGPSLMRLVGYAWPLFWIALPYVCIGGHGRYLPERLERQIEAGRL